LTDKELLCRKEHVEFELATHRTTIQEQQAQIDILDNALTNAQANVVRLEDEVIIINFVLLYLYNS